jgi:hypothetical protein
MPVRAGRSQEHCVARTFAYGFQRRALVTKDILRHNRRCGLPSQEREVKQTCDSPPRRVRLARRSEGVCLRYNHRQAKGSPVRTCDLRGDFHRNRSPSCGDTTRAIRNSRRNERRSSRCVVSQVPREPCKCRLHNAPAVSARASLRTSFAARRQIAARNGRRSTRRCSGSGRTGSPHQRATATPPRLMGLPRLEYRELAL